MPRDSDARVWLRMAGFDDLADEIDRIMQSWKDRGLKTRRNWWEALAGTPSGKPMVVEGVVFPILAAVRQSRGLEPVKGALKVPSKFAVPAAVRQVRWLGNLSESSPQRSKKKARRETKR